MKTDDRLDRLLDADRPEPSPGFDARFFARLSAEGPPRLDDLLDADRPAPSAAFDGRFEARLAADGDARLDDLLDADAPRPSADFDARFMARLEAEASAEPSAAGTGAAGADAPSESSGARVLQFRRRWAVMGTAVGALVAMAAALALWLLPADSGFDALSTDDLGLLANLELLEVYDELQVLDAIEDESTFEAIALLHTLDEGEGAP